MPKPRILIHMHYMELGGAERALLGLLEALDTDRVSVDLLINQHTGPFMPLIPGKINLLPEMRGYNAIEQPMRNIVLEGQWRVAWARWKGLSKSNKASRERGIQGSAQHYIMDEVIRVLPSLEHLGTYDLALSFIDPPHIVQQKISARKRMEWLHTDFTAFKIDQERFCETWDKNDYIVAVSDDLARIFVETYPQYAKKTIVIENILSPAIVRRQSDEFIPEEMPEKQGVFRLLSVGRIAPVKNYKCIPQVAKRLKELGLKFVWYVVGPGNHDAIDREAVELGVAENVRFLGSKNNPYPYIKACDIFVQPSLREGKSMTVREAQVLCKPVIITRYATANSQLQDGVDGSICELDNDSIAEAIYQLAINAEQQHRLKDYLAAHDYGNETEVEKLYKILNC